tara:strand:- start:60 stop:830 length:771 start_codon:yes stop_codon:yes gene_type:complete
MAELSIEFNPEQLIGKVNEIEKVILPRASKSALWKAVFYTARTGLKQRTKTVFKNPVAFTQNAFLYRRPELVGDHWEASVYVRDFAPKGNSPSRYLYSQIHGGRAYRGRFQRVLGRIARGGPDAVAAFQRGGDVDAGGPINRPSGGGGRRTGQVMLPTSVSSVRRNKWGNMSQGQYVQIKSALESGNRDKYFFLEDTRYSSTPGIYMRRKGKGISKIMTQLDEPVINRKIFPFYKWAEEDVKGTFTVEILKELRRI